jgi:hypothetical protein
VVTLPWTEVEENDGDRVIRLIQENYGTSIDSFHRIDKPTLSIMITASTEPTWVSIMKHPIQSYDAERGWFLIHTPMACVFSHSYIMMIPTMVPQKQPIYYINYLSVSTEAKKDGQQLLYSHLWNSQRHKTEISLFKKEGASLPGCRPWLSHMSYYFYKDDCLLPPDSTRVHASLVENRETMRHVFDHMEQAQLDMAIFCDMTQMWNRIRVGGHFIGVTHGTESHQPTAYYFFSRDWIEWHEDGYCLHVVGSKKIHHISDAEFYQGWSRVLRLIMTHSSTHFTTIKIDEVGDNKIIRRHIRTIPWKKHENHYYFHNYIYPWCVSPERAFLLL